MFVGDLLNGSILGMKPTFEDWGSVFPWNVTSSNARSIWEESSLVLERHKEKLEAERNRTSIPWA